jgi:hypothetical protein
LTGSLLLSSEEHLFSSSFHVVYNVSSSLLLRFPTAALTTGFINYAQAIFSISFDGCSTTEQRVTFLFLTSGIL